MTRLLFAAAVWLAGAISCAAAPLEAYGRLPAIETVDISPDGKMIAAIMTNGEQRAIAVSKVDDGSIVRVGQAGDVKVRRVEWAGPEHLVITTTTTARILGVISPRGEFSPVFDLNITTGRIRQLLSDVEMGLNVGFGSEVRIVDGHPLVLIRGMYFPEQRGRIVVYRIDLDRGVSSKRLPADFADTIDWVVDAKGEPVAQESYEQGSGRWTIRTKQAHGGWKTLRTDVGLLSRPTLEGLGRDGQSILVSMGQDTGRTFHEVSLTGEWSDELPFEDVESFFWDPARYHAAGYYALVGEESRYTYFDPADERVWGAILKAYPGQRVRLVSWSENRRRIIVDVDSPTEGPAYAIVDLDKKTANWLGAQYPTLKPEDIGQVRPVSYKAKDGLQLTGYLTLPQARAAKNLPLVVLPHGGPATRDRPGFDWWAQAIASRGYAVLQVNYRGSDGFGWEFLSAGFGEWGRKMQTDLSEGVRHLASQGIIDPKRVCIVGASYGGYAALAGAAIDRGVYRCAASVAGPSDLRRMVVFSRGQTGVAAQRYWLRFMGADKLSDDALDEISPASLAEMVEIPVLLVHGRDDTVVPLEQSQIMQRALAKAGKPVEMVVMKGEDHWLSRGETRQQMLQAVVGFLERNNPPS